MKWQIKKDNAKFIENVLTKKKRQHCSFLNRYDFAYIGRDAANQAAKVAPGVIKMATNDINNIAKERINQIISQGGKEMERVLPKKLRGAIKDVYEASFRLLGNLTKLKKKKRYYVKYTFIIFHYFHILSCFQSANKTYNLHFLANKGPCN